LGRPQGALRQLRQASAAADAAAGRDDEKRGEKLRHLTSSVRVGGRIIRGPPGRYPGDPPTPQTLDERVRVMALHSSFDYNPETDVCYRTLDFMGYPGYRVGDDGSVWGSARGQWRRLKPWIHKKRGPGRTYLCLDLTRNGRRHSFLLHRLILEAFVGPRPRGMECRHLDGNPMNNALFNICWGSHAENTDDSRRLGRFVTKLTEWQVREIRARWAVGGVRQDQLAADYGTTRMNVSSIVNRASWRHIA
jgi:hypothetical protein